uniref:Metacaspase-1 (EC) n=1 Tax=Ganoderma boninense TaxID=34458 RepID=A0A5K1K5L1_9APHY|nr:Metacaspase-1 (EC [Ganoderma boninense]
MSAPAESALPQLPSAPKRLTDTLVCEPASHPPLPSLAIVCDYLPWTIVVVPTPGARWAAPYVTVGDVLHTLYRTLRLGATEHELGALEPGLRGRVLQAYAARYRRVADPRVREAEKAKGVKRVDYLCDRTAFGGFAPVPGGNPAKGLAPGTVWALQVARP